MTAILSALITVDSLCAINITVRPLLALLRASWTIFSLSVSRALKVGSKIVFKKVWRASYLSN